VSTVLPYLVLFIGLLLVGPFHTDNQSFGASGLQAQCTVTVSAAAAATTGHVLHVINKLFLLDICCRENDLEIVLPTESDDVDIDSSSIVNVCLALFLCIVLFVSSS